MVSAALLALALGAAFGALLAHQIQLQRVARRAPGRKEAHLWQRITYAGLSFSVLAIIVIVGKYATSVGYQNFIFLAAAAAASALVVRLSQFRKK
jgi:hypothetical protein